MTNRAGSVPEIYEPEPHASFTIPKSLQKKLEGLNPLDLKEPLTVVVHGTLRHLSQDEGCCTVDLELSDIEVQQGIKSLDEALEHTKRRKA